MLTNSRKNHPNGNGTLLDAISRSLLTELTGDARLSLAELGRRVGLSAPAVAERLQRLQETGVVRGWPTSRAASSSRRSAAAKRIQLVTSDVTFPPRVGGQHRVADLRSPGCGRRGRQSHPDHRSPGDPPDGGSRGGAASGLDLKLMAPGRRALEMTSRSS
jgi:hypothetical protein